MTVMCSHCCCIINKENDLYTNRQWTLRKWQVWWLQHNMNEDVIEPCCIEVKKSHSEHIHRVYTITAGCGCRGRFDTHTPRALFWIWIVSRQPVLSLTHQKRSRAPTVLLFDCHRRITRFQRKQHARASRDMQSSIELLKSLYRPVAYRGVEDRPGWQWGEGEKWRDNGQKWGC